MTKSNDGFLAKTILLGKCGRLLEIPGIDSAGVSFTRGLDAVTSTSRSSGRSHDPFLLFPIGQSFGVRAKPVDLLDGTLNSRYGELLVDDSIED